jgi:hypothetical protein
MAATLPDETTNRYYEQYLQEFAVTPINYADITTEQQTREQLSASEAAYLEPYYAQSMKNVLSQARSQRAQYDADAASRGMTQSTYLTDVKGRTSQQAQSDITNLRASFQSTLAQQTNQAYQAQLNRLLSVSQQNAANRLSVDQWNAQEQARVEALAWQRAFVAAAQERARSSGGGGGGGGGEDLVWSPISGTYIPRSAAPSTPIYSPGYLLSH